LIALLLPVAVCGQEGVRVNFGPENGLELRADSSFLLRFHFRMQDRAAYLHTVGTEGDPDSYTFQVRRFRLKLEGHALSPKLGYKVQLGLSERDMNVGDGQSPPNALLDALVLYQAAPRTRLAIGQGKVPGGRLALISSGEMELPERALANSDFSLDRDLGLFAWQQVPMGGQRIHLLAAITQGEGRAAGHANAGLCYTGRAEWLPFGEFNAEGEYAEGDLLREARPKLALAVAYSANHRARRAHAQQGPGFPSSLERSIGTFFADAVFKYHGWSIMAELERRLAHGSPVVSDTAMRTMEVVNEGLGLTGQVGCMIGKRSQVAARWSMVRAEDAVQAAYGDQDEAWAGYSHYLNGHRIKVQGGAYYTWRDGIADVDHTGNTYGLLFQIELGF
jgi:hypothetical protein